MKRISALVLALIICLVALPAHASELDFQLGSAFACGFDTFRLYFDALTAGSGYAFSWDENALEAANGVKLHTAANEDATCQVSLFDIDGLVAFECVVIMDTQDAAAAENAGGWLGTAMMSGAYALYMAENGALPSSELQAASIEELTALSGVMSEADKSGGEDASDSYAYAGTLCGYPAGMTVYLIADETSQSLIIEFMLLSKDANLGVIE